MERFTDMETRYITLTVTKVDRKTIIKEVPVSTISEQALQKSRNTTVNPTLEELIEAYTTDYDWTEVPIEDTEYEISSPGVDLKA